MSEVVSVEEFELFAQFFYEHTGIVLDKMRYIFFGKKIIVNWRDGLFFSDVMILRAFSRTNGFLSGLWAERFFSPRGILNFSKIFLQKNWLTSCKDKHLC